MMCELPKGSSNAHPVPASAAIAATGRLLIPEKTLKWHFGGSTIH